MSCDAGPVQGGGGVMNSLSHVVDAVRSRFGHVLDHLEDPQGTYAHARTRQLEMLGDVRQRLAEIEAEYRRAGSDQERERLSDERYRLRELEERLLERIGEFERKAGTVAAAEHG